MRSRWIVGLLALGWALSLGLVAGAGSPVPSPSDNAAPNGVVLHELHTWQAGTPPETLVTCIAPGRLRLSHASGDAIVDVTANRLVILDRRTLAIRTMPFTAWEAQIAAAAPDAADTTAAPRTPGSGPAHPPAASNSRPSFELIGPGGEIAGFPCTRHHLFVRHQIFPGEFELVDAEIWVTDRLALPPEAMDVYTRVVAALDRVDFGIPLSRPSGVTLRTRVHRAPESPGGAPEEESSEVLTVERRAIDPSEFALPAGAAPADSTSSPRSH